MKRKNKGGFSLVEVVIALSIIVVVTAAGLSITLSSINTKLNAINKTQAQNFADNVWECFKVADSTEEFEQLLPLIDIQGDEHSDPYLGERDGTEYYIYTHKSGRYQFVAEISVRYVDGERPKLKINVTDGEGGKEIISFSYEKGEIFTVDPNGEGGGNDA